MKKKIIIAALLPMLVLPFSSELSYNQPMSKQVVIQQNIHNPPEIKQVEAQIDYDVLNVSKVTGWDMEISKFFVSEANIRGVDIWEEVLPLLVVETRNQFRFDLVHVNTNGTQDKGVFQINDITYKDIVKYLKAEGREFDSWSRLDPYFNITAGLFWVGHLKSKYELENHALFTSYNRGVGGARNYYEKNGHYQTTYSKEVEKVKNSLLKHKNNS